LKADVYLTGGPHNCIGSGLPNGTYYFQVTNPSASTLLSTDGIGDRTFTVSGGFGVINGYSGGHFVAGTTICGGLIIQLLPYADTPNNGGVYKLTAADASCTTVDGVTGLLVSTAGCFRKTDNFKVKNPCTVDCGAPTSSAISGVKFYDANHDGLPLNIATDFPLENWEIDVTYTFQGTTHTALAQTTDSGGNWSVLADVGTSLTACEVISTQPNYQQTYPNGGSSAVAGFSESLIGGVYCWTGTVPGSDTTGLDFGNVATVSGTKYYDTNKNGVPDGGELPIDGFQVVMCTGTGCNNPQVTTSTVTAGGGNYSFYLPTPTSTFQICEIIPPGTGHPGTAWVQTGPLTGALPIGNLGAGTAIANSVKCWIGPRPTYPSGPVNGMYLTNVCTVTGGKTLGFWHNKNGQALETAGDFTALTAFHLRNADGSDKDFTGTLAQNKTALATWLLNGNAVNMAYMLSVQMTATYLSTQHGLDGTAIVDGTSYGLGIGTINSFIAAADALLADGLTLSGNPDRAPQEQYKNLFDAINNNLVPLTSTSCTPVYP
jgi:hypothetical protein